MHGIPWLRGEDFEFPAPERANRDGLLAMGGSVTPSSLRRAYRAGIFPWPVDERFPVLWFCPDRRFVMELDALRVSRSLRRTLLRGQLEVRWNTAFPDVVASCALPRPAGGGTWIDHRIAPAFVALHNQPPQQGVSAHSVEVWDSLGLQGGLYGVAVGGIFCGESMFHRRTDASKVALVALVHRLRERGFDLLDCQVRTDHLESLGAVDIPRAQFLRRLEASRDREVSLS